jgi:geranylgeranyl pyrophosphate synthase
MERSQLNSTPSFLIPLQEDIQAVERIMLSQADGYHPDLQSALKLILSSGGKRIRTALTLLTGQMLGAPQDKLKIMAAAIELLHTATLVHDDLIDGSILRRGMPTLNSQWSPGATVLTGDFLFARAAKLAAETDSLAVMHRFSTMLTVVVNGEITQLFASRCKVGRNDYFERIYAKTASLFETASWSASSISLSGEEVSKNMHAFGYHLGMAFQIVDDILDFTGKQATIGKPVGSDLRQGLITLPAIQFIEDHPNHPGSRIFLQGDCLHTDEDIQDFVQSVSSSDAISKSYHEAEKFVLHALEHLKIFPLTPQSAALEELANYIIGRTF